jgi:predicted MFS family arabinose efflux permease
MFPEDDAPMIRGRRRDRAILLPAIGAQLITTTGMFIVPVLLDALQRGGLRATTAGLLFSLELTASAVTTLLLPTLCRPHSFRRGALLGGLLAILGNALTLITPAYLPLLIARLITGFGAGIVAAEATMVLARGFDRERLIAAITIAAIVNAAFWLVILPYTVDVLGYRGPYVCLLLICLGGTYLLARLPSPKLRRIVARPVRGGPWRMLWVLVAVAIFATQLGQGAFWGLEETFGAAAGVERHAVAMLLSLVTLLLLAGAMGVAWAGTRFGRFAPLLLLTGVNAMSILAIALLAHPAVFIAANLVQSVTNLSSVIYQLGLAASLDRSGRVVAAGTALITLGNGIGPSLSTSLHAAFGTGGVGLLLLGLYGLAIALYCLVRVRVARGEEPKADPVASGIH